MTSHLVRKAYPFAQTLGLRDFESWCAFVERFRPGEAGERGVIVAENARGYICGILFFQVDRRTAGEISLNCDPFLVTDMLRHDTPVRALLEAADAIALERGCRWVRVVLPSDGDPLSADKAGCEASLLRAGYSLESVRFRRRAPTKRAEGPAATIAGARK